MTTNEYTAAVRKVLRSKGFKGQVRHGSGTAYTWVDVRASNKHDQILLASLGFCTGCNVAMIDPDNRQHIAQKLGFEFDGWTS